MRLPVTPTTTLWRELRDEVRHLYGGGRVVVAVDGVEGAGKSTFADGLAEVFAEAGSAVYRAGLEGFHRPRAERFAQGRKSAAGYYRDSFDYATFRRVLIDPFRDGAQTAGTTGFQLSAFDVVRDAPVEAQWVTAPRDAVLIVDGVFLHRPELRDLWDWSIWLDVPEAVAAARLAIRDGGDPDPSAPAGALHREARAIYERESQPELAASAIVDNSDLSHPRREYRDFC
jgi:uridine kinase